MPIMRNVLYVILLSAVCQIAIAQAPANDECTDPIDLGITPTCDTSVIYNNFEATPSNIGANNVPPCFQGTSNNDVWFTFTTTDAEQYDFTIKGIVDSTATPPSPMNTIEAALYTGVCDTNMLNFSGICFSGDIGSLLAEFSTAGLAANTTYFLRINSREQANDSEGNFTICIEETRREVTLEDELSVLCEGTVTDSGVDTAYSNNEDFIFTICPDQDFFELNCLILTMGAYELETKPNGGGDYFIIYDGKDTTGNIIGSSRDLRDTTNKSTYSGINNSACQAFRASSGCMTILWHTDSTVTAQGFSATWSCSNDSCEVFDTMTVAIAPTDDEIISTIQGRLLVIDSIARMCADTAYGIFDTDSSDFKMAPGLVLTTGRADSLARPNLRPDFGWNNDTVGIPLLDSLSKKYGDTTLTHDGCAMEFTFTPETDVMMLEFGMGSEEYNECLIDQLTDILGLFYKTEGVAGDPMLDDYQNIAQLFDPAGNPQDIQISTISPYDSNFWIYYSNNTQSTSMEYDGIMTNGGIDNTVEQKYVLIQTNVEPCQDNFLLSAIADRGDSLYDSGIMISNMRCLTPVMGFMSSTGAPFLIEECNPGQDFLTFEFPRNYDVDTEWKITFAGSATQGQDYTWNFGDMITLPAGQDKVSYEIDVINDMIEEGSEFIEMTLLRDWGCGEVELAELTVEIRDRLNIDVDAPESACFDERLSLQVTGDLLYLAVTAEPSDLVFDPNTGTIDFNAEDDIQIIVKGSFNHDLGSCEWYDTVNIVVVNPQVTLETNDPLGICLGETVELWAVTNEDVGNRTWNPTELLDNPNADTVVFTPDRFYPGYIITVTVDSLGCSDQATLAIQVDTIADLPFTSDTFLCLGESVKLLTNEVPGTYLWSPGSSLDDNMSRNPTASPDQTTTYTVNYSSENGWCRATDEITIEVLNVGDIDISDPIIGCIGDTITLNEIGLPDSVINVFDIDYNWFISEGDAEVVGDGTSSSVRVVLDRNPSTLNLMANIEGCERNDSVVIQGSNPGFGRITTTPDSFIVNCADVEGRLTLEGGNVGIDESTIEWFFNGELFASESLTFMRPTNEPGTGTFKVTFSDENGCPHEYTKSIIIDSPTGIIPNVFTPMGANNQVFKVHFDNDMLEYEVRKMTIYSSWGDSEEVDGNIGWDGTFDGEDVIGDVYLYTIELIDQCGNVVTEFRDSAGEIQSLQGDVTLVK